MQELLKIDYTDINLMGIMYFHCCYPIQNGPILGLEAAILIHDTLHAS